MSDDKELIRVEGITKRFGEVVAVNNVDLSIRENEFFALLGPSGCGKTTLLRMIAGLETPDLGHIFLDDVDLVGLKPWKRPVNMMFQSYALFPHMSVYDNVAYGLRQERVEKAEVDRRVKEVLDMVGLLSLAARRPDTLSGGQQQRVALARAVVKRPRVLLLDEPLAALDRKLRVDMRSELKRLQHEVGIAFVFVTHDQEEALTMADRAAVMSAGQALQIGTPEELYELPISLFVANFIGESNIFPGVLRLDGGQILLAGEEALWRVSPEALQRVGLSDGTSAAIVVRPEHIQIEALETAPAGEACPNTVEGQIQDVIYLGSTRQYIVELDIRKKVLAQLQVGQHKDSLVAGARVRVGWALQHGVLVGTDA